MSTIKLNNNIENSLETARELNTILDEIEAKSNLLLFLTTEDIQKATGFSKKTVERLFKDPEFPSCDYGKGQIVELHAAIKYFSVPRRKDESFYWLNVA